MIDITMVSTIRPSLLKRTLDTWCEHMLTDTSRYRLILNVDAIGEQYDPTYIVDMAKSYFPNITYNINTEDCSHSKAFKWCWDQVESDHVLLIDDDWELLRPVDVDDMINKMDSIDNLANLRLLKVPIPKINCKSSFKGITYNSVCIFGSTYAYINDILVVSGKKYNQMTINPSLFNGSFVKQVRPYLDVNKDPELLVKMRGDSRELEDLIMNNWEIGMYVKPGEKNYIKDIGREWMKANGVKKKSKQSIPMAMQWDTTRSKLS